MVASAVPGTLVKLAALEWLASKGSPAARISVLGSTPNTRPPRFSSNAVKIPVPEPTSAVTAVPVNPHLAVSKSRMAGGYPGRYLT